MARKAWTCDTARGLGIDKAYCSRDRVTVWHGSATPATVCGFHAHANVKPSAMVAGQAIRESE